jgi:hypothetical protein
MWYSQQAEEGKAPGYPLGFGPYRETYDIRPVKIVGSKEEELCDGMVRGFWLRSEENIGGGQSKY